MNLLKRPVWLQALFLSIFLTGVNPVWAAHSCEDLFADSPKKALIQSLRDLSQIPPTKTEIYKHLTAVHATKFIPEDGFLTTNLSKESQWFRTTVHFSLGEMVKSHNHGGWDDSRFAVLILYRDIEPQVINVYH